MVLCWALVEQARHEHMPDEYKKLAEQFLLSTYSSNLIRVLVKASSSMLFRPVKGVLFRIPTPPCLNFRLFPREIVRALGQTCRSICFDFTMRHLLASATFREWLTRLTELDVSESRYGAQVAEGSRAGRLGSRGPHETGN